MFKRFIYALSVSLLLMACNKENDTPVNTLQDNCLEYIAKQNDLSIFSKALVRVDLKTDTQYQQASPYSIFAPVDSVFINAGLGIMSVETMNIDSLRNLIYGHILYGRLGSSTVAGFFKLGAQCLATNGYKPILSRNYYGIYLNGFKTTATVELGDGVVHKINGVAFPGEKNLWETIKQNPELSMLATAIEITSVLGSSFNPSIKDALEGKDTATMRNVNSMLAPTNAAFQALGFTDSSDLQQMDPYELIDLLNPMVLSDYQFTADFAGGALIGISGGGVPSIPSRSSLRYQSLPDGLQFKTIHNIINPRIIQANIKATNGALHIVDQVILP